MPEANYKRVTGHDRDDLLKVSSDLTVPEWPEFMLNDPVANKYWGDLYRKFPEYQFLMVDGETEDVVASCNSVPLFWEDDFRNLPDEGWDWALAQAFEDLQRNQKPTVLCAISVTVPSRHRKKGISAHALRAMKQTGREQGLHSLIAPVRPTMKHRYPLTPMRRYVNWKDSDGIPKDPWLRVHAREGGRIVKICPRSMRITGPIDKWEEWTGMRFPGSDFYIVPGALAQVKINWDINEGTYVEPNVWMVHEL